MYANIKVTSMNKIFQKLISFINIVHRICGKFFFLMNFNLRFFFNFNRILNKVKRICFFLCKERTLLVFAYICYIMELRNNLRVKVAT